MNPDVSVLSGLQIHCEDKGVAIIEKIISFLIISQDCYGRVLGWNLKVIARLERERYDERRALCAAAHLEQEEVLPGIRRHFGFYLQSILSVTIAMVQQSEWNV